MKQQKNTQSRRFLLTIFFGFIFLVATKNIKSRVIIASDLASIETKNLTTHNIYRLGYSPH
jgi:hypothetical protein